MLRNVMGGGGVRLSLFQCYDGVWSNVISVTTGWMSNFRNENIS